MRPTLIILCLTLSGNLLLAQTHSLSYEPSGKILVFHLDNVTFQTDTTALLTIWKENCRNNDFQAYYNLRKFIVHYSDQDTIAFYGNPIAHFDTTLYNYKNWWHIEDALQRIIVKDRVRIVLKDGSTVRKVKVSEQTSESKGGDFLYENIVRTFSDKNTGTILFQQTWGGKVTSRY